MKTTNNTVLISGGTAGIGLEIAKLLQRDHVDDNGHNQAEKSDSNARNTHTHTG